METAVGQKNGICRVIRSTLRVPRPSRKIGEFAADLGIKYITFYAFSTENWKRSKEEVSAIMNLFREYLKEALGRARGQKKRYPHKLYRLSRGYPCRH